MQANRIRDELRELAGLMLPLALVQVGYTALGFVDTAIAGLDSGVTIAGVGLGGGLFYSVAVLGSGTALVVDPLVSQALGAGDRVHARRVLWNGIYLAAVITVPLTMVMLMTALSLTTFGVQPEVAEGTFAYLLGRAVSLFPLICAVTMRGYLQASGHPRAILWAVLVANLLNGPLSYLFLPRYGALGVGVAATIGTLGQLVILAWVVSRVPVPEGTEERYRRFDRVLFAQQVRVGMPIGLQMFAEIGAFVLVGVLMARISSVAIAGHQVALMFASISFSVCVGMGSATSVQVGRAIGAGDSVKTRRVGMLGLLLGGVIMLLPSVVMTVIPDIVVRLMTRDPEIIEQAAIFLRIAAVFQIVDGVQAVGAGALRGAGMTRVSFAANLVGHWIIGIPLALLLTFGLDLGPAGLWWGLTVGLAVVATWLAVAFWQASKQPIVALRRDTAHG
ncbi:MAG: MATE family efflux transporter [Myxococcota bacterium]